MRATLPEDRDAGNAWVWRGAPGEAMYRCELCKTQVDPYVPSVRVVLATRPRDYPPRGPRDRAGSGWEVVREAVACPPCAARHAASEDLAHAA